jgi:hypothetical protein
MPYLFWSMPGSVLAGQTIHLLQDFPLLKQPLPIASVNIHSIAEHYVGIGLSP